MIALVLGGARSGKSAVAERLTAHLAGDDRTVTYLATATVAADDPDFAARIDAHRHRRPAHWRTVETGLDLPDAIGALPAESVALVDSLGTWLAGFPDLEPDTAALVDSLRALDRGIDLVAVAEEVGLGVHPATPVGRRFRDQLGSLNQAVSALADEVHVVIAGRLVALVPPPWPDRPEP